MAMAAAVEAVGDLAAEEAGCLTNEIRSDRVVGLEGALSVGVARRVDEVLRTAVLSEEGVVADHQAGGVSAEEIEAGIEGSAKLLLV